MILTMILIIIMIINAEDNLSGSFAVDPTSNKPICLASDSCLTKPHPSFIFNKTRCIWCKWHLVHLQIIQVQWCTAQCTLQCAWPSGSERRRRINEELYMYLRIITLSGLVGLRTCTLYMVIPNPWISILKNIPNFQSSFLNETKKTILHCFVFIFVPIKDYTVCCTFLNCRVLGLPVTNKSFTSTAVFPIYVCTHIVIDCRYPLATTLSFLLLFVQRRKK